MGRGRHEVTLEVGAGKCGWQRQGEKVGLDLYIQYDAHVQQVVDEKIRVECNMATREGRIVEDTNQEESMSIPVKSDMSFVVKQSMGENQSRKKEGPKKEVQLPRKRGRMENNIEKIMGWLDVVKGNLDEGVILSRPLEQNEDVMLVAKVKQQNGMDTMLTQCGLKDEFGHVKLLTDERGCSLDSSVVSNTDVKFSKANRVKKMFSRLQVPRLSEETAHLTIRCSVVVCEGSCPKAPCVNRNSPIRMVDVLTLETETDVIQARKLTVEVESKEYKIPGESKSFTEVEKVEVSYLGRK